MTYSRQLTLALLIASSWSASACSLRRPDVAPARMIEPLLVEPQAQEKRGLAATPVRLLDTHAREHIGRRLLHQQPQGELSEDSVWSWSSNPDRYLDSALRLALAATADLRPVDTSYATTMGVTLIEWHVESSNSTRLVGAVEVAITAQDRSVLTQVVRASEPLSPEMPGDLAAAAGRLLTTLAAECVTRVTQAVRGLHGS